MERKKLIAYPSFRLKKISREETKTGREIIPYRLHDLPAKKNCASNQSVKPVCRQAGPCISVASF